MTEDLQQANPSPSRPDGTRIGCRQFIGGVERPVYFGADGRQYVLDDDAQPVYGDWILIDNPEMVQVGAGGASDAGRQ